jgi:hypothetical protein
MRDVEALVGGMESPFIIHYTSVYPHGEKWLHLCSVESAVRALLAAGARHGPGPVVIIMGTLDRQRLIDTHADVIQSLDTLIPSPAGSGRPELHLCLVQATLDEIFAGTPLTRFWR